MSLSVHVDHDEVSHREEREVARVMNQKMSEEVLYEWVSPLTEELSKPRFDQLLKNPDEAGELVGGAVVEKFAREQLQTRENLGHRPYRWRAWK